MDQLETLTLLVTALGAAQWYPAVGILTTLIVGVLRMISPEVWSQLPRWSKPIPAIAINTLTAFVAAYQLGVTWQIALAVFFYQLVVSTLISLGLVDLALRGVAKS